MKTDMIKKKRSRACRMCGNQKSVIRKYDLLVCRRCFKEIAETLGFRKFG